MPDDNVKLFKSQLKSTSRAWFWLSWNGTGSASGTWNRWQNRTNRVATLHGEKRIEHLHDLDQLHLARSQYRTALADGLYKRKKFKNVYGLFWPKAAKESRQKMRLGDRISVRTKTAYEVATPTIIPFRPYNQFFYVRVGLRRPYLVRAMLIRVYTQGQLDQPPVYQEILKADNIDWLPHANTDDTRNLDDMRAVLEDGKIDTQLTGSYEMRIWVAKDSDAFDAVDGNLAAADPVVGPDCVHNRHIGKREPSDLEANPTLSLHEMEKVFFVVPKVETKRVFMRAKYYTDGGVLKGRTLVNAVGADVDRKIQLIYDYIDAFEEQKGAEIPEDALRILILPEWFFMRTIDGKIPASEQWYYTGAEKNTILDKLKTQYTARVDEGYGTWLIFPGSILWAIDPAPDDDSVPRIVFNMAVVVAKPDGGPQIVKSYYKSVEGQDTPTPEKFSSTEFQIDGGSIGANELNARTVPEVLKQELLAIIDPFKEAKVAQVITEDTKWLVHATVEMHGAHTYFPIMVEKEDQQYKLSYRKAAEKPDQWKCPFETVNVPEELNAGRVPVSLRNSIQDLYISTLKDLRIVETVTNSQKWLAEAVFDSDLHGHLTLDTEGQVNHVKATVLDRALDFDPVTVDGDDSLATQLDASTVPTEVTDRLKVVSARVTETAVVEVVKAGATWTVRAKLTGPLAFVMIAVSKEEGAYKLSPTKTPLTQLQELEYQYLSHDLPAQFGTNTVPASLKQKIEELIGTGVTSVSIHEVVKAGEYWIAKVDHSTDFPEYLLLENMIYGDTRKNIVTITRVAETHAVSTSRIPANKAFATEIGRLDNSEFSGSLLHEFRKVPNCNRFKKPIFRRRITEGECWAVELWLGGKFYTNFILKALTDTSKFKLIPRDYYAMNLSDTEWGDWLDAGAFGANKAAFLTNINSNQFTTYGRRFSVEICAESQTNNGVAMQSLCAADEDDEEGVDYHIIPAVGAAPEAAFFTCRDNGCTVLADGESKTKKFIFELKRRKEFSWYVGKLADLATLSVQNRATLASEIRKEINKAIPAGETIQTDHGDIKVGSHVFPAEDEE
jgi:hypothetical protein